MKTVVKSGFAEWRESETAETLRSSGGAITGGGEVFVICSTRTRSDRYAKMITKDRTGNTQTKES